MSGTGRKLLGCAALGLLLNGQTLAESGPSGDSLARESRQVAAIDQRLREAWRQYQIAPSSAATEGEWCRRLYLDLLGRIPTVDELTALLKDRSPDRREQLVERLLTSEAYVEDYARNWTTIWTNLLLGRTGGTDAGDFSNRPGMQKYLRDCFARNRRYDEMVFELITATGATVPGTPQFNGATNFLANKLADQSVLATAKTSQIFLGVQVQCTQCHNHPFNDWKQNQFWELNAFFRQTRALRRFEAGTRDLSHVELIDQDFAGEGHHAEQAEIYYEQRNGILKAAFPVFVDGTSLESHSGYVSDVNRRRELAQLVVQSDYLSSAAVNRLWAHFLGYGFTQPVDDLGPHNPVAHPELLEYLADEFRHSRYDLKQLMRWIVLSQPYALSSRTTGDTAPDDPELGEPPLFSRFYLRQMRPEELYESLLVATQAHKSRGSYEEQEAAKSRWLQQFNSAFGTDEGDETTTFNGSIPQVLMMFNGELMRQATSIEQGSFLARVARSDEPPTRKIEYLFLAALSRKPTSRERQLAQQLVIARSVGGSAEKSTGRQAHPTIGALQDIWWAVLNSNEFILNH